MTENQSPPDPPGMPSARYANASRLLSGNPPAALVSPSPQAFWFYVHDASHRRLWYSPSYYVSTLGVQLWISCMGRHPVPSRIIPEKQQVKTCCVGFHPLAFKQGVLTLPLCFDRSMKCVLDVHQPSIRTAI
ncbi:hypothetical protein [Scytonema sp. HK-05]|uniref:hypothetical protein n=1 Tax=Scytonema sp. HK-05 TaxID=1137095 RepID=UPI001301736B